MFLNFEGLGSKTSVFRQQNSTVGGILLHETISDKYNCLVLLIKTFFRFVADND